MRKHSVRKWLHAILDLLPVIILPIFAIYSHRHTIDSYEVTVPQNEVVNFNQLVTNFNFTDSTGWYLLYDDYASLTFNNGACVEVIDEASHTNWQYSISQHLGDVLNVGDKYLLFVDVSSTSQVSSMFFELGGANAVSIDFGVRSMAISEVYSVYNDTLIIYPSSSPNVNDTFTFSNVNLFNLTKMFGVGNEPSIEQFDSWYPNTYYDYNEGTKQLLKNVSTVTYDNSDIGSQMIYSLYKPINDYFNLNNVFNFGDIYDWFELNMFNGNAPLSIFIVWNIIVYEFIMDIIFLIYSVFMFVIDFANNTLDRFTGWAKRGD